MVNTETKRLSLIQRLAVTEDESILNQVEEILDRAGRISIEQYNREIEETEAEISKGDFITQEELEKRAEKW